ncbi:UNVERIFIED_CONTAM: hypothetical protein FKN15_057743 [Acipenser sinensis]
MAATIVTEGFVPTQVTPRSMWRQEQGLPTRELEFPASGLQRLLQKGVWPTPKQESSVPELPATVPAPEPGVPVQEPELFGQEPEVHKPLLEEELNCPAPPQPRHTPLQSSPELMGTVPCPVLIDNLPECMDVPVLDLVPRSVHRQAQLLTWSLAQLPLKPKTSRRGRVTSLAFPLHPAVFPLESQMSLHRLHDSHFCLSLHHPGYRPTCRSPLASRFGPSLPDRGPILWAPDFKGRGVALVWPLS